MPPATPPPTPVRFGRRTADLPGPELAPIGPGCHRGDDPASLRARLAEDGFLWVRSLLPRAEVLAARAAVLGFMAEHEGLEPGSRPLEGVMGGGGRTVQMQGRRPVTHLPEVLGVLEHPNLFALHEALQGEPVVTFPHKWLRAVGREEFTGAHVDHVYMGRGSGRVLTTWLPLDDLPLERGVLAVCRGSHRSEGFARVRATYGQMDVDRDGVRGWFSDDPVELSEAFGGQWVTGAFEAGDALVFGMHTMHASTTNTTDRWRLSCDVRFQPAADPVDPRWEGEDPIGHDDHPAFPVQMAEARAAWGL